MAVKRQSYAQFETAEETESISVASLRRSAEALGCELVYFLVPAGGAGPSFKALARSHDPQAAHHVASDHSLTLESGPHGDAAG